MPSPRPSGFVRSLYPRTLDLFRQNFDWRITGRWMLYSALVGVAGAFASILFAHLVEWVTGLAMGLAVGHRVPVPGGEAQPGFLFDLKQSLTPDRRWLFLLVPALGGLLSGWVVFRFASDARGAGTDAVIRAYHHQNGIIN